jgi:antitoxin PrlF
MGCQSKITSKGQTTIPQEVRDYLKLKPGDRVQYVFNDGSVVMVPKNRSIADLAGILGTPPEAAGATISDMDEAIGKFLAEDDERISHQWHKDRK